MSLLYICVYTCIQCHTHECVMSHTCTICRPAAQTKRMCCSVLQRSQQYVCCNVWQRVAASYSVLQWKITSQVHSKRSRDRYTKSTICVLQCVAMCCSAVCTSSINGCSSTAHMNESWHIWRSHGTYEWVMAHINDLWHISMSHVTHEHVWSCVLIYIWLFCFVHLHITIPCCVHIYIWFMYHLVCWSTHNSYVAIVWICTPLFIRR